MKTIYHQNFIIYNTMTTKHILNKFKLIAPLKFIF
jgi:hypothetical protein